MVVALDIEYKSAFNVYVKDLIKCSASSVVALETHFIARSSPGTALTTWGQIKISN